MNSCNFHRISVIILKSSINYLILLGRKTEGLSQKILKTFSSYTFDTSVCKFEMDLGRLATASEVTGGHTLPF
jgi:hypothetical protein